MLVYLATHQENENKVGHGVMPRRAAIWINLELVKKSRLSRYVVLHELVHLLVSPR